MGAEMVGFVNRLRRSGPPSLAALVGWRPDEGASSGVFTRALADAVSHPAGGSHVQEFLAPETLTGLVESSTPDYQHARFIQMSYGPTEFFPNPRFDRRPSGLDLRTQQREQVRRDRAPAGHVFISYSHSADAQYVERLAAFLEDAGVPAWYDREIISGDRWRSVIREQIETCSLLIVVMTPEAEASHWVTREIDWAEKRGKPICPLLLAGDVWFGLNDIQCENVSGGVMPSRAFVDRIRRVLRLPAGDSKEDRDVPLVLQPVRVAALTGHTGAAVMFVVVAFAPNGGIAATGGFDGRVLMWDVSEPLAPRRLAELADQGQWVMALAFSPTGGIMATGGSDTRVLVWDVSKPSNPRRLAEITDHTGSVRAVAFSPDGRAMASGGADKRVLVWDLSTPAKPRRTAKLTDHTEVVFAVAFSADGLTLATGSDDKRVLIWDLSTSSKPRRIAEITDHTAWVRAVAFSPDGRILVTGGADERVLVWDLSTPSKPRRLAELTDHRSLVNTVVFSSDGLMLATGGDDRRVLVWDLSTPSKPRRLAELAHHGSPVNDLAFNPDGTLMASSSLHEGVALWQMNTK
jgi:hypothetical protein